MSDTRRNFLVDYCFAIDDVFVFVGGGFTKQEKQLIQDYAKRLREARGNNEQHAIPRT